MRTIKLLLPLLLCFSTFLAAQKLDVGFQAGFGSSEVTMPYLYDNNNLPIKGKGSFSLNVVLSIRSDKRIGLSAEPGYILKGFYFDTTGFNIPRDLVTPRINFHYAQLPLLIHYHITKEFTLSTGPELAYMVGFHSSKDRTLNTDDSYNKFDLAALLGFSYHFSNHLTFGARISRSLTDVQAFKIPYYITLFKGYNQYGQLFLRYTI